MRFLGLAFLAVAGGYAAGMQSIPGLHVSLTPGTDTALTLLIAVVAVIPIGVRIAQHRFDLFEPIVPAAAAFLLLYVGRPLYEQAQYHHHIYVNVVVDGEWRLTLLVVLVSVFAFNLGYLLDFGELLSSRWQIRLPSQDVTIALAAILTVVAGAALLLRAYIAGGIHLLLTNRSAYHSGANSATVTLAITLALPAMLLLWSVSGRHRTAARWLISLPLTVYLLLAIPGGNRRFVLVLAAAIVVFWYARHDRRPSVLRIVVVVCLLTLLVINPARQIRTGQASYAGAITSSVSHPLNAPGSLLAAQDTTAMDSLAMLLMDVGNGKPIPFMHGADFVTETVLQPFPHSIVPRPDGIRNADIKYRFGYGEGRCSSLCPTYPVMASFWADFGFPSVAVGCFLLGVAARWWWGVFQRNRHDVIAQAAYASTFFLWFYVWWDSLGSFFIQFLLLVLPLLVARWLGARSTRRAAPIRTPDRRRQHGLEAGP